MVPNFFLVFLKKCVRLTPSNLLAIREFVLQFQHHLHISCQSKTWQRFKWMCKAGAEMATWCWNGKCNFFWSLLQIFATFFGLILRKKPSQRWFWSFFGHIQDKFQIKLCWSWQNLTHLYTSLKNLRILLGGEPMPKKKWGKVNVIKKKKKSK